MCIITSPANSESFTSFFSNLYSFYFPKFPWLGLPKLCWIIMTSVGTLVLFLVLEEMLCFSPLRIACCWFAVYSLFYVEVCFFSLEKGMTPHSCLENPMDRGAWLATVQELQRVGHDWVCMQVPSVPNFRRVFFFFFIIHRCWIFSKAFYASIEMIIDHMVSSFNLLIWCATSTFKAVLI